MKKIKTAIVSIAFITTLTFTIVSPAMANDVSTSNDCKRYICAILV